MLQTNVLKPHSHKRSAISKKDEREFEKEIKKQETLEENTKKVYKGVKRCTDTQAAQCRCESKLVHGFASSTVCREDPDLQRVLSPWQQSVQRLEQLVAEMNETELRTVAEPMKKLSTIFPNVAAAAKKREQSLQEYNKLQAKLDKYSEKERTGAVLVKREASKKAFNTARDDFEAQNSALMEDMPRLYDSRLQYIDPSLRMLVKSQIKYYTEAHKTYSELEAEICTEHRELSSEDFSKHVQHKLTDIRALSITADD